MYYLFSFFLVSHLRLSQRKDDPVNLLLQIYRPNVGTLNFFKVVSPLFNTLSISVIIPNSHITFGSRIAFNSL